MIRKNAIINRLWDRKSMICFFLVLMTFAIFYRLSGYDFVNFDDDLYVTANSRVQKGLNMENIVWAFSTTDIANWHPLTWLSHMLDVQLWGMNSGRHHLVNVFFHITNALLLFLTLNRMTGAIWRSGFVAVLFALHPINVESVAWVAERKNVLSTFFWMMTLWSYCQYAEKPIRVKYLAVILFFMLGLMTKPMLVTLPFVLLLLDYWPLKRFRFAAALTSPHLFFNGSSKSDDKSYSHQSDIPSGLSSAFQNRSFLSLIREKIPLFVLSAFSCGVTYLSQDASGAVRSLEVIPLTSRIANALVSYVGYIGKMIYPLKLAVFYPYPAIIPGWRIAGAGSILITMCYLSWKIRVKHPYVLIGWFWYLGTLIPVIGLVQVGSQAMADRHAYVPLIGLFIAGVWSVSEFLKVYLSRYKLIPIVATLLIGILFMITWKQIGYWKNSATLFQHTIDVTTDNYLALNNLGNAMVHLGKNDEAYQHYTEALRIKPHDANAHYNMGILLTTKGKLDEAIGHYKAAIRSNPYLKKAYYNLGTILQQKGSNAEAIINFLYALRLDSRFAEAHNNLGVLLAQQGKINEAAAHFLKAVHIKTDYIAARKNLQKALSDMRRID